MPRLTKADAALRNLIFGNAALKTKRKALASMLAPSETFLLELMSSSVHPKLKTDAAERLAVARSNKQRAKSNAAKGAHREEFSRAEIDRILRDTAQELGLPLTGDPALASPTVSTTKLLPEAGDPKTLPESCATESLEPPKAASSFPPDGVSIAPVPVADAPGEQLDEKRSAEREALLVRGRDLASRTISQYNAWTRAPWNKEQDAWLRGAQKAFSEWEREMNTRFPEVDTRKLFDDGRLRPYELPISTSVLARALRTLSPVEAHWQSIALARQATRRDERRNTDDDLSIWSGLPKGI